MPGKREIPEDAVVVVPVDLFVGTNLEAIA